MSWVEAPALDILQRIPTTSTRKHLVNPLFFVNNHSNTAAQSAVKYADRKKWGLKSTVNGKLWPIVLQNSVSGSSEKILAAMSCFILSDMRGHKKKRNSR
jgi:hypothetical protein